jgi:hypothetical protein
LSRVVTDDLLVVPLLLAAFASIDFCNPLKNISPGPPKADIAERRLDLRSVPIADEVRCSKELLFDHLVGERKDWFGDGQPERLRSLEIDHQFKFRALPYR